MCTSRATAGSLICTMVRMVRAAKAPARKASARRSSSLLRLLMVFNRNGGVASLLQMGWMKLLHSTAMRIPINDLPPLDNRHVKTSTDDVLVDQVFPGELLVISFGFVAWDTRPDFDFYGRLKKLEQFSGRHINKILVRDSGNSWYHRTIDGLGAHPDETAASLRALIREIRPSKVVTIGQSM